MSDTIEATEHACRELSYDPKISIMGIYPEKNMIQKDICTLMLIEALYVVAKTSNNLNIHQQRN